VLNYLHMTVHHKNKKDDRLLIGCVVFASALLVGYVGCTIVKGNYATFNSMRNDMRQYGSGNGTKQKINSISGVVPVSEQWVKAKFTSEDYHSVHFEYPSDWDFKCCEVSPVATVSTIHPDVELEEPPHIAVYDFVMLACLDEKDSCATTPAEYYAELKKSLETEGRFRFENESRGFRSAAAVSSAQSKTMDRFENSTTGSVFYIVQTKEGVAGVLFNKAASIGEDTIQEFMRRISG